MTYSAHPAARLFTLINATGNASHPSASKVGDDIQQGWRVGEVVVTERRQKKSKWLLKSNLLVDRVGVAPHTPRCRPRNNTPQQHTPTRSALTNGNRYTT